MFGRMIYYDRRTINDYKAIIQGGLGLEIEECEISNDKGINADLKLMSANKKSTKAYKAKVQVSDLFDCEEFEKLLKPREDYFDFTELDNNDILAVPNKSIIKASGRIEIPEEFDMVKMIEEFKPIIMQMEEIQNLEQSGQMMIETVLKSSTSSKIPLIFDGANALLCSKVLQNNLIIDYEELSDIDDDVTILARVTSCVLPRDKAYYDPLKDFLKMNRTLRKSFDKKKKGFIPLLADSEYRVVDMLAIYLYKISARILKQLLENEVVFSLIIYY